MNILQTIQHHAKRLEAAGVSFGHGTDNAFDEAAWLVLWQLNLALDELHNHAQTPISTDQAEAINTLVDRRISTRQPTAYLTREAWLQGISFYVDERAIIPRSLIAELLATDALDAWLHSDTRHILDLCTGNGSLAILAALAYPNTSITAADICPDALEVARINVRRHAMQQRINCLLSNGMSQCNGIYDLILCNPPYVNSRSMTQLPAEYRKEPALALAGGDDGMDFVRTLLRTAPEKLSDTGILVLEIGHERKHFEAAFPQLAPVWLPTSGGNSMVLLLSAEMLSL